MAPNDFKRNLAAMLEELKKLQSTSLPKDPDGVDGAIHEERISLKARLKEGAPSSHADKILAERNKNDQSRDH